VADLWLDLNTLPADHLIAASPEMKLSRAPVINPLLHGRGGPVIPAIAAHSEQ
jgi:hypothetical protein